MTAGDPRPGPGAGPEDLAGSDDRGGLDEAERRAVEAVLLVAEGPVPAAALAELLERGEADVEALLGSMASRYESEGRGFVLRQVAGGWRFQSHPDCHDVVERFVVASRPARLSPAAVETLAIVAYKQPISRAQLSEVRGVDAEGALRTLVQRGYVAVVGHDPGPGHAALFATTPALLERLGIASLDELPPLGDFVPSAAEVEALEGELRQR